MENAELDTRDREPGPRVSGLRTGLGTAAAIVILVTAAVFALRHTWPWPRLRVAPPIVVSQSFVEALDTLRVGETLSDLFSRHGLRIFTLPALSPDLSLDPRRLRAGLVFSFRRAAGDSLPSRVVVRTGPEQRLSLVRAASGWNAVREPIRWSPEIVRVEGRIDNSLYQALDQQLDDRVLGPGERERLAWDLADVYAWEIDFTRDIQPGDHFRVLLERLVSEEGEIRFGRVLAGDLTIGGTALSAYRFDDGQGRSGFYDAEGLSLRRAFLRAPLQFRRISSSFSRSRYHPILATWRRHEGTDYAAAPGTPVLAAGDGVVSRAESSGGYGNLIEIRHRNGITTRYGHLRGFAPGLQAGSRVVQGQEIGYVGATGLASGPHLHYEFRVHGVARNSRSLDLGAGEPLPTSVRPAFERVRADLAARLIPSPNTRGTE